MVRGALRHDAMQDSTHHVTKLLWQQPPSSSSISANVREPREGDPGGDSRFVSASDGEPRPDSRPDVLSMDLTLPVSVFTTGWNAALARGP